MSALNRTDLKDKFNNASTGLFKTGQSRGIGSDDQRTQVEDMADSHFNLDTDAYTGAKGLKNSVNTIAGLQAIVTTSLTVPFYTIFRDTSNGNVLRVYELVAGTDATNSPYVVRPTDYAASTNEKVWKLADGLLKKSGVISSAEILTANASPVTLVAAPGSGIVILPFAFFFKLDYNSAAYATNITCRVELGNTVVTNNNAVLLPATADTWSHMTMIDNTGLTSSIENTALTFKVITGNPTAGNSPIYYTVLYAIAPTS